MESQSKEWCVILPLLHLECLYIFESENLHFPSECNDPLHILMSLATTISRGLDCCQNTIARHEQASSLCLPKVLTKAPSPRVISAVAQVLLYNETSDVSCDICDIQACLMVDHSSIYSFSSAQRSADPALSEDEVIET